MITERKRQPASDAAGCGPLPGSRCSDAVDRAFAGLSAAVTESATAAVRALTEAAAQP